MKDTLHYRYDVWQKGDNQHHIQASRLALENQNDKAANHFGGKEWI